MIIKASLQSVEKAMANVTAIVNDKLLQEDLKNVIIWIKDGVTRFVGYNANIISAMEVEAEVDVPVGEEVVTQLKAKDVNDILASFRGLKRTVVSGVEFHIEENEARLHIIESPANDELRNADAYNTTSKFRVTKPRLKDLIKSEVQKMNLEASGKNVASADLLLYINCLLPTVDKETREATSNINFGDDEIYTVLVSHAAIMPNKLDDEFKGFRLPNGVVKFIKSFLGDTDSIIFDKQVNGNGSVTLTINKGGAVAQIKCADMSRAFDISNFIAIPNNGIMVDKLYLIDVLKRMNLSVEAAFIEVDIQQTAEGKAMASMKVQSKAMNQTIPVLLAKGEGEFAFTMRADLLANIVFSHASEYGENVFIYLDKDEKGNIIIACKDNSELWHTKLMGVTPSKSNFAW